MNHDTHKDELTKMLADITLSLSEIGIHNPENPADWIAVPEQTENEEADPNLIADAQESYEERRALVAQFETRYNNITKALKKIDEGTYGTCEVCGGAIEAERLSANPAARTDIAHMNEEGNLPLV